MRFKYLLLLFFCFLLVGSCTQKKQKINNKGLLTQEELTAVLFDIHLFDAMVYSTEMTNKTRIRLPQKYYDSAIFVKHECTDSIFQKSVEYYTLKGEIKSIYDAVIDSLNVLNLLSERNGNTNRKNENSNN